MIVQPDTLLRWHRDMFRRMWRRKSKRKGKKGREASAEVIGLGSRRLLHFGLTRSPNGAWVALQLREATPFGQGPRFLIRDNDNKFGGAFDRVADGTEIEVLTALYQAPKANAICERFPGSVRPECLDYFLILSERHL
jgi:putative transposase